MFLFFYSVKLKSATGRTAKDADMYKKYINSMKLD